MKIKELIIIILINFPLTGIAHPGHDHYHHTPITHYFTSPFHIITILIFVFAAIIFLVPTSQIKKWIRSFIK